MSWFYNKKFSSYLVVFMTSLSLLVSVGFLSCSDDDEGDFTPTVTNCKKQTDGKNQYSAKLGKCVTLQVAQAECQKETDPKKKNFNTTTGKCGATAVTNPLNPPPAGKTDTTSAFDVTYDTSDGKFVFSGLGEVKDLPTGAKLYIKIQNGKHSKLNNKKTWVEKTASASSNRRFYKVGTNKDYELQVEFDTEGGKLHLLVPKTAVSGNDLKFDSNSLYAHLKKFPDNKEDPVLTAVQLKISGLVFVYKPSSSRPDELLEKEGQVVLGDGLQYLLTKYTKAGVATKALTGFGEKAGGDKEVLKAQMQKMIEDLNKKLPATSDS